MRVWFRDAPLSQSEQNLLAAVLAAHDASARRGNISADVVARAAIGSGSYFQALAAGLLTLGGTHGPIEQTFEFLNDFRSAGLAADLAAAGLKVPGWGNSFHRGEPDLLWTSVHLILQEHFPEWHEKLNEITAALHSEGKKVYPNPSTYTAVTALILGAPKETAAYLLVAGRLAAWTEIIQKVI